MFACCTSPVTWNRVFDLCLKKKWAGDPWPKIQFLWGVALVMRKFQKEKYCYSQALVIKSLGENQTSPKAPGTLKYFQAYSLNPFCWCNWISRFMMNTKLVVLWLWAELPGTCRWQVHLWGQPTSHISECCSLLHPEPSLVGMTPLWAVEQGGWFFHGGGYVSFYWRNYSLRKAQGQALWMIHRETWPQRSLQPN